MERLELVTLARREHACRTQALVGCAGLIIVDAMDPRTLARLAHEQLHRREEVRMQPDQLIDAPALGIGGLGGK